jgi:dipeptidyl-peptidase 4
MKKYFFAAVLIGIVNSVHAQNNLLTMQDAMVRNRTDLAPENLRQLQFIYGTDDHVY